MQVSIGECTSDKLEESFPPRRAAAFAIPSRTVRWLPLFLCRAASLSQQAPLCHFAPASNHFIPFGALCRLRRAGATAPSHDFQAFVLFIHRSTPGFQPWPHFFIPHVFSAANNIASWLLPDPSDFILVPSPPRYLVSPKTSRPFDRTGVFLPLVIAAGNSLPRLHLPPFPFAPPVLPFSTVLSPSSFPQPAFSRMID